MKKAIILIVIFFALITNAQSYQFVKADSGLIVRKSADKKSERIGKLVYGSEVRILESSGIMFELEDEGKTVKGEWVKIEEMDGDLKGYVFSGFLTEEMLSKKIEVKFKEFIFVIPLNTYNISEVKNKTHSLEANLEADIGDSPEGKEIKIYSSKYQEIQVFQRFETSISIQNEGPHCDLTEWKHFYSEWNKIPFNQKNKTFNSFSYNSIENSQFINIDLNEIKEEVKLSCGENWYELIKEIKNVNEYPSSVSISKIYFKVILTDKNGSKKERLITIQIPMGC